MNDPAVLILLLEQGDRSLEDHTEDFLSGDGPRERLATFIEWVLVSCESSLTVDYADNDTSPNQDPEPSPPSPRYAELPEPTAESQSPP
ncbi:Increased DNA methylation 1 [Labeo rohita]|uniref:Increased DNA methylation 1 n=1 Tax=Labeo rohita TaxID=84645 RepID=A0ABQ8MAM4_LABRO|nr:Increased DNA methylation 1 [Labeo rohita]